MSEGVNKVILLGNLGADPELRYTGAGQAVCNVRLATTESYVDKDGEKQERTEWHSIVIWGKRGEALSKILTKGMTIYVEGGLRTSSYEKDGEKRYKTEVHATDIKFTGKRGEGASGPAAATGSAKRTRAPQNTGSKAAPTAGAGTGDYPDELSY